MKTRSVVSLAALVLLLIAGVAEVTFGVLRFNPLTRYTDATMLLSNSDGLAANSPVLLTGIRIGRVTAIRRTADGAEADLRIDSRYHVPTASGIRIESLSALGEPYIEFQPPNGSGPYIRDGQLLDTRTSRSPATIPAVSIRVVELIDQLDPHVIDSLLDTADTSIAGTDSEIPRLARSTDLLAATLLSRTAPIRQLLTELQAIGANMGWAGPGLADSGPQWATVGQELDQAIQQAARLAERRDPRVYLTGDGVVPVLGRLNTVLGKVGPSLGPLAPVLQPLVGDAADATRRLDISALITQALDAVGDDGALRLQITTH